MVEEVGFLRSLQKYVTPLSVPIVHHCLVPYLPDGSKWQRNQTIPEELDSENRLIDWEAEIQPEFEDTKSDLSLSWKVEE